VVEIFGIPMSAIAVALLVMILVAVGLAGIMAWRNRVILKLGVRNIGKRRAQTALIVLGLMLSTLIITSAFGTGDTIVYTLKSTATLSLDGTDETIDLGPMSAFKEPSYFDCSQFDSLSQDLSGYDKVDGLAPCIREIVPVVDVTTKHSASSVVLFAPDPEHLSGFGPLTTEEGTVVNVADLGQDEVFLDREVADDLEAQVGDELNLYYSGKAITLHLKAVVRETPADSLSVIVMPLSRAQEHLNKSGQITTILVSNAGDAIGGAKHSDEVTAKIESLLKDTKLEVHQVKKDALEAADDAGSIFTTIFAAFGLFSIAAGLLLIFLIFMLLAAARKSEMGMARAVGIKRHHLIQMFLYEGTVYDLAAALVGVVLGLAVTFVMVDMMVRGLRDAELDIIYHITPRSLFVAFAIGALVTFATVVFSAWRVSRVNIVRAIRDLPEPRLDKVGRRSATRYAALTLVGLVLTAAGIASEGATALYLGVSFLIIGLSLLWRSFGLRERYAFSLAGAALLIWWLLPFDALGFLGELDRRIELFFLGGMLMVLGGVWLVTYNLDVILRLLTATLGRLRGMAVVLKTSVAYSMSNRFRTGLTVAMFSLVIFVVTFMSVVISASTGVYGDVERFGGGYDIGGNASYTNPIPDISAAIKANPDLNINDFEAIASEVIVPLQVHQSGTKEQDWSWYFVSGVDDSYLDTNEFPFIILAQGYSSPSDVWKAIREEPGLAVITSEAVPSKHPLVGPGSHRNRDPQDEFGLTLEGIYREDTVMSPIDIEVRDPRTPLPVSLTLKVIGVLEGPSINHGLYTYVPHLPVSIPFTTYLFKLKDGVDASATADSLEAAFLANGMEAKPMQEILDDIGELGSTMNALLRGFMSLGLIVGVAALGVISSRAVVERRHDIGVLRAIGLKRRTVQLGFLVESSVVALLGMILGVGLALLLAYNVIDFLKSDMEGLRFQIPWAETLAIAGVAYAASLLMTFLVSRQASKIYPAEALRYE